MHQSFWTRGSWYLIVCFIFVSAVELGNVLLGRDFLRSAILAALWRYFWSAMD